VTNRINRDRLERHGSTYRGIEMPDFVKCDDPWFRPVDIKLGPDGCLYVADFYNRIIGHYEVPLTHPGRDRDKGRIWRIVYRGKDGKGGPKPYTDLAKADVPALVKELDNPNLSVRLAATNQLASRPGMAGADAVGEAVARGTPWQKAHGLWVLQRLGGLDEKTLVAACHANDVLVRVHAQRILSERRELTPALRDAALAGLHDTDAFVQRAAAEALGAHPRPDNIAPLLVLRRNIPPADTHLLHAVRMALRDQLRTPEAWQKIGGLVLGEQDQRAIADVCLGVHDAPSAEFLKRYLKGVAESKNVVQPGECHVTQGRGQPWPLAQDALGVDADQHVFRVARGDERLFIEAAEPLEHPQAVCFLPRRPPGNRLADGVRARQPGTRREPVGGGQPHA
jgi:hypothetical protein